MPAPDPATDIQVNAEGDVNIAAASQPEISVEQAGEQATAGVEALMAGDIGTFWENYSQLFTDYIFPAVIALLILVVAYFVGRFLGRQAGKPVRKRVDETLGKFVAKVVFYGVMVMAFLAVLGRFGFNIASFAAILAAAGFAVGLAFQGTLSNFAAGVMLLVFRPFKVGDVCVLNGQLGKIDEIDLFVTHINTLDNRKIIMPNGEITGSTIEVITHHPQRRIEVLVGTAYSADIDQTREVLESTLGKIEGIVEGDDRGFKVVLDELGGSSVNWKLWAWAEGADFLAIKQQIIRDVKVALDTAGISIPFPQLDVHMDRE